MHPFGHLRAYAHQFNVERCDLRCLHFSWRSCLFTVYRYGFELFWLILFLIDHSWYRYNFFYNIRTLFSHSRLMIGSYHVFFLLFAVIHWILMLAPNHDVWFVLTNYMLLDCRQDYRNFVQQYSLESSKKKKKGNEDSRLDPSKYWPEMERKFWPILMVMRRYRSEPLLFSREVLLDFARQLRPLHVPNALLKSKLAMIMVHLGAELGYLGLVVVCGTLLALALLFFLFTINLDGVPLWITTSWLSQMATCYYEYIRMVRLAGYLLFGGLLVVHSVQTNLIDHNRLLAHLTNRGWKMIGSTGRGSRRKLALELGIRRYRVEMLRTVRLLMQYNGSVLGQYFVLLVLAIVVPVSIVVANAALWGGGDHHHHHRGGNIKDKDEVLVKFLHFLYLLFQIGCLFIYCNMFATITSLIHSTRACFVSLQGLLGNDGRLGRMRTKLSLMVMHEQINSNKSLALSLAGIALITRQTMFRFALVYMAYFLKVNKRFV